MSFKKFFNRHWAWSFVIVPIFLQIFFFYKPLIQGVYYSMTDWSGLTRDYNFIGFDNFRQIFVDVRFRESLGFTAFFTISLTIGSIVLGIALAMLLNQKIKGIGAFRTIYFFPAVVSSVTLGLIFNQFFSHGLPQVGNLLGWDWLSRNLVAHHDTAPFSVLFVALWQGVALPIAIFLSALQSVPEEIKEAATIDGANKWQVFRNIELPFLSTALSMVFILSLRGGLTAFDLIFSLSAGGPGHSTAPLGLLIYNYAFQHNRFGYANAIAVLTFIFIAILSVVQIYFTRKKEA